MLPYLVAERAPVWEPDLPGAYLGLRRHHTRAHLVRAAVEGVCMQIRLIVDRLDTMRAVRSVRASGGVFRSPLWREVMAATIGRPLHLVGDAEGTARGAAALAIFALGRAPTPAAAAAQLGADDASPPVRADAEVVAVYDRARESVPALIASLDRMARAFRPPAGSA